MTTRAASAPGKLPPEISAVAVSARLITYEEPSPCVWKVPPVSVRSAPAPMEMAVPLLSLVNVPFEMVSLPVLAPPAK